MLLLPKFPTAMIASLCYSIPRLPRSSRRGIATRWKPTSHNHVLGLQFENSADRGNFLIQVKRSQCVKDLVRIIKTFPVVHTITFLVYEKIPFAEIFSIALIYYETVILILNTCRGPKYAYCHGRRTSKSRSPARETQPMRDTIP